VKAVNTLVGYSSDSGCPALCSGSDDAKAVSGNTILLPDFCIIDLLCEFMIFGLYEFTLTVLEKG
jgi:hypothetical protein